MSKHMRYRKEPQHRELIGGHIETNLFDFANNAAAKHVLVPLNRWKNTRSNSFSEAHGH